MKKVIIYMVIAAVFSGSVLGPALFARAETRPAPPPTYISAQERWINEIAKEIGTAPELIKGNLENTNNPGLRAHYENVYGPPERDAGAPAKPEAPARTATPPPPQEVETNCMGGGLLSAGKAFISGRALECMAAWVTSMVMWVAARALWMAGVLLNYTLNTTLNMSTLLASLPIVDIGWQVIRDIANIVFIFIALWSGISIIIGIGPERAWGLLAHMVLVALFVNFSLFITKTVVDLSNVAALHFYDRIVVPEKQKDLDGGL
ncbi:MAG: Uncharacterized protein Greene041679_96, partial [Parcubacteria group bacterium Greene0416_79]